jgi:hypothetical protein
MDSQHRHELQQNDLRKLTDKALPFAEKYALHIVGVVVALLVVVGGVFFWFNQSNAANASGWSQFDRVLHKPKASAGDFAEIAESHPGTPVAVWASLKEAEDYLKAGLQSAFTNQSVSRSDLKSALEIFEKLSTGSAGSNAEIRERALFGMARCLESLSDGKTDDAVSAYTRLLREFPKSIFGAVATERIKSLETKSTQDFYAWFHAQKIEPFDPRDIPIKKPLGESRGESEEEPTKPETSDDTPASAADPAKPDEKPAEKPEEAKPEGEAKSEEAKPDETNPAADKS